ncbi:hypothetical protein GIB67_028913 [Kingdonia uniflora]|uniref:Uncharacterized protein n=1 Tax=Kingdonia uniflora TaxID=39325 RepID=A0A7J7LT26_9MAGN|nr:hypothetical protein GIB67_028913 [Kingdonia uniflora]
MTLTVSTTPGKVNLRTLQKLSLRNNLTCILVFGDSSVDPGNNNRLLRCLRETLNPTGRTSSMGALREAKETGFTKIIPGFLDPHLKKGNLMHGVSFAFVASGYNDLTANLTVCHLSPP